MTTRTATVRREGDWWVIDVQGVGVTQAKRLDQVDRMARDMVSLLADVPAADVQVAVTVRLDPQLELARQTHERLRREADTAAKAANEARERLMRGLQAAKLSSRDIAELTGVSHQRVSQIVGAVRDAGRVAALSQEVARTAAQTRRVTRKTAPRKTTIRTVNNTVAAPGSPKRTTTTATPAAAKSRKE